MNIRQVRNIRRVVQAVVLILFIVLLLKTGFSGTVSADALKDYRIAYPVKIFLEFDPLISFMTILTGLTLYTGLLWSLVTIVATIFFGRFFCGWICPMGTVNQVFSTVRSERLSRRGLKRIKSNQYHWYQKIKYYILLLFVGAGILGLMIAGIFDPISLLIRSLGLVVIPILAQVSDAVADVTFDLGIPGAWILGWVANKFKSSVLLTPNTQTFNTIFSLGLFFLLVLAANRFFTRFWCRGICPLGAFLGLISRWSIFGLEKREDQCDQCNKCLMHCQGADGPQAGVKWRKSECHVCLNCQAACDRGALKFKFFPKSEKQIKPDPDITRRKVIGATAVGLGAAALFGSQPLSAKPNDKLIRPPGATAEDLFSARCIRCGECMKVCPTNALHPTFLEAGWEGIWSPILIARIGYCEPSCTLCGQVCPTGAIRELTLGEKVGDQEHKPNVIGTAFFDRGRCLPWAMATSCVVCEEWCPTSPKAIYTIEEEAVNQKGETVVVKRPYIDPNLCTGCGACEYACPVTDKAAVYVTSVGESRAKDNQIVLEKSRRN
jgi:polyferredoxin